jgi:4-hydroxy-tetrahydrodipicolinate reductase
LSEPVKIAIAGALGRMGQAVAKTLDGRTTPPGQWRASTVPARAARGWSSATRPWRPPTRSSTSPCPKPRSLLAEGLRFLAGGPAVVIGSTGFSPEQIARIDAAATKIAIVRSGNYSLGVNMLMGLVRQAAAALPASEWDIEVYEAHHKRKIDAPSGTALMLGQAAADGREVGLGQVEDRAATASPVRARKGRSASPWCAAAASSASTA